LNNDEVDGALLSKAVNWSKPPDCDSVLAGVGVFERRDVVDSDLKEDVRPLNDVLKDMAMFVYRWYRYG
jgi:hypothetical protein